MNLHGKAEMQIPPSHNQAHLPGLQCTYTEVAAVEGDDVERPHDWLTERYRKDPDGDTLLTVKSSSFHRKLEEKSC